MFNIAENVPAYLIIFVIRKITQHLFFLSCINIQKLFSCYTIQAKVSFFVQDRNGFIASITLPAHQQCSIWDTKLFITWCLSKNMESSFVAILAIINLPHYGSFDIK